MEEEQDLEYGEDLSQLPAGVRDAIQLAMKKDEPFATLMRNGIRIVSFVADDRLAASNEIVGTGNAVWIAVNWRPLKAKPKMRSFPRSGRIKWTSSRTLQMMPTPSGILHIRDTLDGSVSGSGGVARWSYAFEVIDSGHETVVTVVRPGDLESRFKAIQRGLPVGLPHTPEEAAAGNLQGKSVVINVFEEKQMATFDQRGQHVQYQYNDAKGLNWELKDNRELASLLEHLQGEVDRAGSLGALSEEQATDAAYQLKKAVMAGKRAELGSGPTVIEHLRNAKTVVEGVSAMGALAAAIEKAVSAATKVFG